MFGTNFTTKDTKSFYNYYRDIGEKLKNREKAADLPENRIDILLVVNMFLTGFDAKKINTLYVDKNLRYHVYYKHIQGQIEYLMKENLKVILWFLEI
jgi:type I restriction enzyme, R subunit